MGIFKWLFGLAGGTSNAPGGEGWSAKVGWHYVTYMEPGRSLSLAIDPMAVGPDIVYVPDTQIWQKTAPAWARNRATEILRHLKSVAWNRELEWSERSAAPFTSGKLVQGSLEASPEGKQLESKQLFHPGSPMTADQVREAYNTAARKAAEAAEGRVTIFGGDDDLFDSVIQRVVLPALRANPNVTLDVKSEMDIAADELVQFLGALR